MYRVGREEKSQPDQDTTSIGCDIDPVCVTTHKLLCPLIQSSKRKSHRDRHSYGPPPSLLRQVEGRREQETQSRIGDEVSQFVIQFDRQLLEGGCWNMGGDHE